MLVRFASERWLYRLSISSSHEQMLLKGAMLFDLWFGSPQRPTRDADFLGLEPHDAETLRATVMEICKMQVDDGIVFDPASVTVEEIRKDANYGGLRVKLRGMLGNARCPVQLDVGYGDAVTPGPKDAVYPVLLNDLPAPRLRVYPMETALAEKVEAIVSLGMVNTRLKDYFDLWFMSRNSTMLPDDVGKAIAATCRRRGTTIPARVPIGLTDAFAQDAAKRALWTAFLGRNGLQAGDLGVIVKDLRTYLEAPLRLARSLP